MKMKEFYLIKVAVILSGMLVKKLSLSLLKFQFKFIMQVYRLNFNLNLNFIFVTVVIAVIVLFTEIVFNKEYLSHKALSHMAFYSTYST